MKHTTVGKRGLYALAFSYAGAVAANAQTITPPNGTIITPDGNGVVTVQPLSQITNDSINAPLITNNFPDWSIAFGAGFSSVLVAPSNYAPVPITDGAGNFGGGAGIIATPDTPVPTNGWIQTVTTNDPVGGKSSPFVDTKNVGVSPFALSPAISPSQFADTPGRLTSDLATHGGTITWSAQLFPAIASVSPTSSGPQTATIYNGVSWGWTMTEALLGNSTGTFANPSPSDCTCSGAGTSAFNWGVSDAPSSLQFVGTSVDPTVGKPFVLGTLDYFNGTTFGGEAQSVNLDLTVNLDNLPGDSINFDSTLALVNTPNTDDPIASADYVYSQMVGLPTPSTFLKETQHQRT